MSQDSKPLHLYVGSYPTPNSVAVCTYLDELKANHTGVDYDFTRIEFSKNTQKEDWFVKLNPNGRIPVLVDRTRSDFIVFETSAILLYLAQHYDKGYAFWFDPEKDANNYSEMVQWIFFAHGGIGPMQGQYHHFAQAPEKIPYAQKRYLEETKRLYGVLNIRLNGRDYLAGDGKGKYSLADIKAFPWVKIHPLVASIETLDEFPNVEAWLARCVAREASVSGAAVGSSGK